MPIRKSIYVVGPYTTDAIGFTLGDGKILDDTVVSILFYVTALV